MSSQYTVADLRKLRERTEYEVWLLEEVYRLTGAVLRPRSDSLIYPPGGGIPKRVVFLTGSANLGDWRPGFLKVGTPLIFVTAFKVLDMLLEWVLENSGDLRNLALVCLSVLHGLSRKWPMDEFGVKRTRHALDELTHLHGESSLKQRPPAFVRVRVYVRDADPVRVDLPQIENDLRKSRPNQDAIYSLNIVVVRADGTAEAFVVPAEELSGVQFESTLRDLEQWKASLPNDLDLVAINEALPKDAERVPL